MAGRTPASRRPRPRCSSVMSSEKRQAGQHSCHRVPVCPCRAKSGVSGRRGGGGGGRQEPPAKRLLTRGPAGAPWAGTSPHRGRQATARILLVGGLGYIGSTLVDTLLASPDDHTITVLDPLLHDIDPAYLHRIVSSDRVRFVKGDVSNMRHTWSMVKQHDTTVYMAALTLPNTARDPEEAMLVNQYMAEVAGDCAAKFGRRMVFMSTCSNYGKADAPVGEDGELFPVSMYALTKVNAERYLTRAVPDIVILRCATAYGVGAGRTRWDVLLNDLTRSALESGEIDVFQPDACRPVCHVRDIARAVAGAAADMSIRGVYNVGSDEQNYTKRELAEFVAARTSARVRITQSEDNRDYRVDFAKIRSAIGFRAEHTPESEVPRLVEEWKKGHGKATPAEPPTPGEKGEGGPP